MISFNYFKYYKFQILQKQCKSSFVTLKTTTKWITLDNSKYNPITFSLKQMTVRQATLLMSHHCLQINKIILVVPNIFERKCRDFLSTILSCLIMSWLGLRLIKKVFGVIWLLIL